MLVVFDLDGTVCDNSRREHIARRASAAAKNGEDSGKIWDEFHEAIPLDQPIWPVMHTLHSLQTQGHAIEIWTARPEKYRQLTRDWLVKYAVIPSCMRMRRDGDWRKAYILKLEWFLTVGAKPQLVFEDHPETVRLLRAAGCVVAQVGEGHNA